MAARAESRVDGQFKSKFKSTTIVGAGTQGRRLAYMWSSRGNPVYLVDPSRSQLDDSLAYIERLRSTHTHTAQPPVQSDSAESESDSHWGTGEVSLLAPEKLAEAVQQSWLVVECVPEKLAMKRSILAQIADLAPDSTIIASNSSSYTIAQILQDVVIKRPERALSLHSYWPPEVPAIEVMGHDQTDPAMISQVMKQCSLHHFTPFHVKQSSTGYIYNRIWAAIKRETLLALSEGVAAPEEIDAIFKSVLHTPKGPCEQMDVVGLDVVLDIEEHYAEERGDLAVAEAPRALLRSMIQDGRLGVKSGKGFYDYDSDSANSKSS